MTPTALVVLFDERCALCRELARWLPAHPHWIPLEILAIRSEPAQRRYGAVLEATARLTRELVVIGDEGSIWIGPSALLMCLWALRS